MRNSSAVASVAPSGRITELEASYEVITGGERTRVSAHLRFTDFGTVRVTPPWYGPNGTDGNGTVDSYPA